MLKLLVLGLDGATFRVLDPLCEEGKLPNISKLIEGGVRSPLKSTFPPHTSPAWATMATGKNPGKTGVFDSILRTDKESYNTTIVNSSYLRKAGTYWDHLSNAGSTISVVNYPFLFPPYSINGSMVSGFGSDHRANIAYPPELKNILIKECGEYYTSLPQKGPQYIGKPQVVVDDCLKLVELNKKSLRLFLKEDTDALVFVVSAGDFAQHFMWKYLDNTHPYYDEEESGKFLPKFIGIWQKIDEVVGLAAEKVNDGTNIIIVSDHGFGPDRCTFYTDTWLENNGYLLRKKGTTSANNVIRPLVGLLKKNRALYSSMISLNIGKKLKKRSITTDMERSIAFSPNNACAMTGKICINEKALISQGEQRSVEIVRQEIIDKLKDTCTNLGLHLDIYTRNDLYSGPYVNLAPDIIFALNDFECSIRETYSQDIFQDHPYVPDRTGTHKTHGILIASGKDFKTGISIQDARIQDIAPTILHMFGLPIPSDMDGKVLTEIFKPGSAPDRREVQYEETGVEKRRIKDKIIKLKTSGKL